MEVRITHDGCAYVHQAGISSNVTADKGCGRSTLSDPENELRIKLGLFWNDTQVCGLPKIDPTARFDLNLLRSYDMP